MTALGDNSDSEGGRRQRAVAGDPWRAFVFPNRIRELRRRQGFAKLLALSAVLPNIPYIRLSKLERGEVFARAAELVAIAGALAVAPTELLIDVDAPGFDIARWAEPFYDPAEANAAEDAFAIKLAAAVKARRTADRSLSVAVLDQDYGLPPVILSRIENAVKPLGRWNAATVSGICRVLGVANEAELRALVEARWRAGDLDGLIGALGDPAARLAKSRARIAALRAELGGAPAPVAAPAQAPRTAAVPALADTAAVRLLPVIGAPRPGGLIDGTPVTGATVEAPRGAGPRAFALRVCRPSLGPGLPGNGIAVADPDVWPSAGGLAVLRESEGYRLVSVGFDRNGAMRGVSLNPDLDIALDDRDPGDLAGVLSVVFG